MNKLQIYLTYLGKTIVSDVIEIVRHLLFPKAWIYLSPTIAIVLYVLHMRYWWLFVIFMIISFILYDYDRGDWLHKYRTDEKKRLLRKAKFEKTLKEVEDDKNVSSERDS